MLVSLLTFQWRNQMVWSQIVQGRWGRSKGCKWVRSWTVSWGNETRTLLRYCTHCFFSGGYSVNGGSGENTYGRKSLGQELRVNNVTNPEFTSVQHGSRALATKDMRKSQGKTCKLGLTTFSSRGHKQISAALNCKACKWQHFTLFSVNC